ncbi:hypothetical protein EEL32_09120 [Brevibacillus laterosporus]|uniref:Uncharacterized protein n=1 Tax=Brevibacillus laterosporus TaxID=1465 RepID=A0A502IPJ8_BRELA|nr:hypothetical protein EEL30_14425 [Brevibacillus laterosporus]TPG88315.1 hypothetical protein EEL32_09120 [Brevibacillus laterosporus]
MDAERLGCEREEKMIPSKMLNSDGIGLILSEEEETTASTEETATATAATTATRHNSTSSLFHTVYVIENS